MSHCTKRTGEGNFLVGEVKCSITSKEYATKFCIGMLGSRSKPLHFLWLHIRCIIRTVKTTFDPLFPCFTSLNSKWTSHCVGVPWCTLKDRASRLQSLSFVEACWVQRIDTLGPRLSIFGIYWLFSMSRAKENDPPPPPQNGGLQNRC